MVKEYHQTSYAPPPGASDILLIRHGRTEAARPGVSFAMKDGHGDPALHPEGEKQAQAVAERLKSEPFAAIYVTTLRRTHQTAAPLAAALRLEPRIEADLREVHLGDWDGGLYRIKAAEEITTSIVTLDDYDFEYSQSDLMVTKTIKTTTTCVAVTATVGQMKRNMPAMKAGTTSQ